MKGQFRYSVWDPILIVSQICAMQSIFYTGLGLWFYVLDTIGNYEASVDHLFKYQNLQVKDTSGRLIVAAYVCSALTNAIALWLVVGRTKQCLDFSVTVHVLHLVTCWLYNMAPPVSATWWILNISCCTLLCVSGEYLCMRTELQAIPMSLGAKVDL